MISLCIPMPGIGKARPRVTRYGTYMPSDYKQWLHTFKQWVRSQYKDAPITTRVSVSVTFLSPTGNMRSDTDNAYASCLDAMNGVVYKDDRQVKSGSFTLQKSNVWQILVTVKPHVPVMAPQTVSAV